MGRPKGSKNKEAVLTASTSDTVTTFSDQVDESLKLTIEKLTKEKADLIKYYTTKDSENEEIKNQYNNLLSKMKVLEQKNRVLLHKYNSMQLKKK